MNELKEFSSKIDIWSVCHLNKQYLSCGNITLKNKNDYCMAKKDKFCMFSSDEKNRNLFLDSCMEEV